ncbi:MAG: Rieske 2Fe-2S domain-containing protein [Gammaproteobacteria bacterium]|jgi:nitrite reductase/ring-hydroxylating ferredoxin subunit|nr:Rieske 2Fe-2S domain-containing protein [Gammaproteobacteria bacterium]MBT7602908.1 Rieske 2Fe-2S domain-containing protein [Gammaproteobacteria bacterium]
MLRSIDKNYLAKAIKDFCKGTSVTTGNFSCEAPGSVQDLEWNHMDQSHRPFIHSTYSDELRISLGENFANSLTKWGNWPFFINVIDVRVKEGQYYQTFTIGGLIYVHTVIEMDFINDDNSSLDISWHILSHWFLRPIHKYLDKKIYKLNVRLQEEDYVIRSQRALLRKYGYNFKSDPPDYCSSNKLTNNTVYPSLKYPIKINIKEFTRINALNNKKRSLYKFGEKEISFIVKKISNIEFYIWPSVCPHEGASLEDGDFCDNRVTCPWHGLNFTGSKLSKEKNTISKYGFIYKLENDFITISNNKS